MPLLFALFIFVPILEMVILIKVGGLIGAVNTVALVLLTALGGAALLRRQGLETLTRANSRLAAGELPARELFEAAALAAGGALLLTPGFLTDALGLALLLPPVRRRVVEHLFLRRVAGGAWAPVGNPRTAEGGGRDRPGEVIEGEFRRED